MSENNQPDQEKKSDDDESVLELTDEVAEASEEAEDPLAATIELEESFDDDLDVDHEEDDFVDSMGMEIGTEYDEDEDEAEETAAEGIDISGEQLDAALERVIKNMFYDKIDNLLVEVIEKTVSKEIERLKRLLTEEVSGDEK